MLYTRENLCSELMLACSESGDGC